MKPTVLSIFTFYNFTVYMRYNIIIIVIISIIYLDGVTHKL